MNHSQKNKTIFCKYTTLMSALLLMGYSNHTLATVTADMTQTQSPVISSTSDGQQVININTPSESGLSHNIYTSFDVNSEGVVLNNSLQTTQSELAGAILANPQLTDKAASIILNEVVSGNATTLQGMIEVAGEKAQVIVANPAGITCSGCGFINTERSTLTTGTPQITDGVLTGYNVEGGKVKISGNGMDDSATRYSDIIANMVTVSAALKANNLRIVTGKNSVDNDTLAATKTGQDTSWFSSKVAVDVTALGGITAGNIMIVATEDGFGVNNAGSIKSSVDDISITGAGYLKNSGEISTTNELIADMTGTVTNSGILTSGTAMNLNSEGNTLKNSGEINAGTTLTINSGKLANNGGIYSAGDMVLDTGEADLENAVSLFASEIVSQGGLSINSANLYNINGMITAQGDIAIATQNINNQNGKILSFGGNMNIDADYLGNYAGGLMADQDMVLNIDNIVMNSSGITVGNDLTINASQLDNRMGGIQVGGKATIVASESYKNSSGVLVANEADITTKQLNNYAGLIVTSGDLTINADSIDNRYQSLFSPTFGIWIDEIGTDGGIISGGNTTITATTLNNKQSRIISTGDLTLITEDIDNASGLISSESQTEITANDLNNRYGNIKTGTNLILNTAGISGTSGNMEAGDDLELNVSKAFSNYHTITAGNNITLNIEGNFINMASVKAGNNLEINSNSLVNGLFDTLSAGQTLTLNTQGMIVNLGTLKGTEIIKDDSQSYFGF